MDKEAFEREKEAEKAHLRKLRELKQTLSGALRTQSSRNALNEMAQGSREALDTHEEFVGRITQDAAISEARMDMALETEESRAASGPSLEEQEEELRQIRAQELVRQMRGELSGQGAAAVSTPASDEAERASGEKTIGRPQAEPEAAPTGGSAPAEKPAKTIGRMRS